MANLQKNNPKELIKNMENDKNFAQNKEQRTKKQHYIRQKYLKNWTNENNKLYVLRKTLKGNQKRIEERETTKIGFQNNFYDISGFSEKDIKICEEIINYLQKDEQFKLEIRECFLSDEAKNQKDFLEKEAICYYEEIEDKYDFINKLANEDLSFYKDNKKQEIFDEFQKEIINYLSFPINILSEKKLIIINFVTNFLKVIKKYEKFLIIFLKKEETPQY